MAMPYAHAPRSFIGHRSARMTAVDRPRSALPLAGRAVAVTHALGQAERLVTLLEAAGACVVLAPVIAIEPPASWVPLDGALARSGAGGP